MDIQRPGSNVKTYKVKHKEREERAAFEWDSFANRDRDYGNWNIGAGEKVERRIVDFNECLESILPENCGCTLPGMSTSFKSGSQSAEIEKTNPITEVNFDSAFVRAKELDEYLIKNRCAVGPLHGLPFSVKDVFDIEGLDTTMGYAAWAYEPKSSKTQLLQKLHEAGAIIYVKTAVPRKLSIFILNR